MNKKAILNEYMKSMYKSLDDLRNNFPGARASEILEIEKGCRYSIVKSSEWIEDFLSDIEELIEALEKSPVEFHANMATATTNTIADSAVKKKKTFFQVAGEASKDMLGDLFKNGKS